MLEGLPVPPHNHVNDSGVLSMHELDWIVEKNSIQKCPFEAIQIINLPKDLDKDTTHRYGPNTFKLHRCVVSDSEFHQPTHEGFCQGEFLEIILSSSLTMSKEKRAPCFRNLHICSLSAGSEPLRDSYVENGYRI